MYSHSFHAKLIWYEEKKSFNFSLRWHCFGWNRSEEPNVCGETGRNSKGDWSCTLITKINNCMIDGNKGKPRASILPYPLSSISQVPCWCGRSRCHFSFVALLPRRAARRLHQDGRRVSRRDVKTVLSGTKGEYQKVSDSTFCLWSSLELGKMRMVP